MNSTMQRNVAVYKAEQCTLHVVQGRTSGRHNGEQASRYKVLARPRKKANRAALADGWIDFLLGWRP